MATTSSTCANDVMHTGVECIGEHQTLDYAAQRMRELDVGALPLCGDDNKLHGIITDRDIVVKCIAEGCDPKATSAAQLATGKPMTARESTDIKDVLHMMEQHQVRRMPIVNEQKQLVGMVCESDLARNLPEEAVGHFVEQVVARSL